MVMTPLERIEYLKSKGIGVIPAVEKAAAVREPIFVAKQALKGAPEKYTLALPIPIWTPLGPIKPGLTIEPGKKPSFKLGYGWGEAFKPTPTPGPKEIVQPVTGLGWLPPEYGAEITPQWRTQYIETIRETTIAPEVPAALAPLIVMPTIPPIQFPDFGFGDMFKGAKNALIIGAVALGGLFLIGKLLEGRK